MFEIAFKVNPDSEFYKNYFMKKAEKEKFLELADEEGKRVMDALYAVWKVKKRGKEA